MTDHRDPQTLSAQVAALSDQRAVQVLALAVYRDQTPPPTDPKLEARLREAAQHADTDTVPVQPGGSDGDLARATLSYLAQTPDRARDVQQAINVTSDNLTERFIDPVTLIIGGLILLALQTEISLDKDTKGRWRFHLKKNPMSDATLGNAIGSFIGAYTPTGTK
jgi:hypothetical protein